MPKKGRVPSRMVRMPLWVLRMLDKWSEGLDKAYEDGSILEGPDERQGWVYWRMVLMLLRRDMSHRERSRSSVLRSSVSKGESEGNQGKD